METHLIERLLEIDGPADWVNTAQVAAYHIEAQQSWIASLEQNARDADRMYKELETELAEQQKRIEELVFAAQAALHYMRLHKYADKAWADDLEAAITKATGETQ